MNVDQFTSYDRITDTLMFFTSEITLKFVVQLSRTTKYGDRRFFSFEVIKNSGTRDGVPTRNINRTINMFLTVNIKDDIGNGFVIKPQDCLMLSETIKNKVLPWFQADSPNYAFKYMKNQDVLIVTKYEPVIYTESEIRYLRFEPKVVPVGEQVAYGVSINLNGGVVFDVPVEKIMEFLFYLNSDLYSAACSMINYVKIDPAEVEVFRPAGLASGRYNQDEPPQAQYNTSNINTDGPRRKFSSNAFLDNSNIKSKD